MFNSYTLGLDIQEQNITAILIKKTFSRKELVSINNINLTQPFINENKTINSILLTENIKNLLTTAIPTPIPADITVHCSIPTSKTFIHIFNLPVKISNNDLKNALLFEAEKIIPIPISSLYFDYQIINENKAEKKVLFACVEKNIADQFLQILESCNLNPTTFNLKNNAIINAFKSKKKKNIQDNVLICDIDSTILSLIILKNQKIQITDYLHINLSDIENILEQIKNFIQKFPEKINKTILNGSALSNNEIFNQIKNIFPREVELGNPWTQIHVKPKIIERINKKPEISKEKAISFASAIGLALDNQNNINLIPENIKEQKLIQKFVLLTNLISSFLIIYGLLAIYFSIITWADLNYQEKYYQITKNSIDRIESGGNYQTLRDNIQKFNSEVITEQKIEKTLYSLSTFLQEFRDYVPKNIKITKINFDRNSQLILLDGIAPDRNAVIALKKSLESYPLQKSIDLPLASLVQKGKISFIAKISINDQKLPPYAMINSNQNVKK
ncbi:MAG: Cell division protein FtsA [Candidatus Peregrinibacteria bacterium GW2011_GWA2_33_10]|nr:MAG: Cell division protein FtsA [Candidatus Peregrinibacteria bacterium GW2011_GWA2_33_10]KKP40799.1 MAG: Tfp pilus assembly protein, ATPase PilM, type IV pilus assembly protein PilM [Candidatus Peregrinibacteria bacterium GW2011_GWC2_33_13]OGJ48040.1 MAG: hypothetical protein A2229_03330 [Candidatus Peregrinibacteria bacterium RIFOXYA2_FULL_33_7]